MEGFLIGLVFGAILVVALLTVSIHGEALELGYRIEDDRRALHNLNRANEALRTRFSMLSTPSFLLPGDLPEAEADEMSDEAGAAASFGAGVPQGAPGRDSSTVGQGPAPAPDPLMPGWNVEWVERERRVEATRVPSARLQSDPVESGQVQNSVDN